MVQFTWSRDERGEKVSLTDYTAGDEELRKDVLDAKVVKGLFDASDYCVVLAKLRIRGRREFCGNNGRGEIRKVLASENLDRREVRE